MIASMLLFLRIPLICLLCAVLLPSVATAQTVRGKARPDDSALVLTLGAQSHAFRSSRREGQTNDGLDRGVGLRFGVNWEIPVRYNKHILFSGDFIQEKGTVLNFDDLSTFDRFIFEETELSTITNGRLSFNESWFRFATSYRYSWLRIALDAGLGFNILTDREATYRFDYERTVNALRDRQNGIAVFLDEPITYGETDLREEVRSTMGLIFGVTYFPVHRMSVRLEYERSVHLANSAFGAITKRGRLGLTVGYRIVPLR